MPTESLTYTDQIEEMLQAIRANIEYLKTKGSSQVRIKNGKLANVLEGGFVYDFDLEWVQDIDEDADIEVRVGQQGVSGKVIAITDATVQVILESHLGDDIPSAMLIISSYYLLERLCEHLEEVKSGSRGHSVLAEKALGLEETRSARDTSFSTTDPKTDKSQEQAIQWALGSEVTFIWGPPGTGKSETIAKLIEPCGSCTYNRAKGTSPYCLCIYVVTSGF